MTDKPQLMMPVSDDDATRRFFVEALRQNTETMKALRDDIKAEREERKEDRKLLNDIHARVIKIESNRLDRHVEKHDVEIEELKQRVNTLESSEDRRAGAMGFASVIKDFGPLVVAIVAAMVALIVWRTNT